MSLHHHQQQQDHQNSDGLNFLPSTHPISPNAGYTQRKGGGGQIFAPMSAQKNREFIFETARERKGRGGHKHSDACKDYFFPLRILEKKFALTSAFFGKRLEVQETCVHRMDFRNASQDICPWWSRKKIFFPWAMNDEFLNFRFSISARCLNYILQYMPDLICTDKGKHRAQ